MGAGGATTPTPSPLHQFTIFRNWSSRGSATQATLGSANRCANERASSSHRLADYGIGVVTRHDLGEAVRIFERLASGTGRHVSRPKCVSDCRVFPTPASKLIGESTLFGFTLGGRGMGDDRDKPVG